MKTKYVDIQPDLVRDEIDAVPRPVVARGQDYPAGSLIDWHAHRRAQLLYAIRGTMTVRTVDGAWVVPPNRAVWIPAGMQHRVSVGETALEMRTVYLDPGAAHDLPGGCCVVSVTPLLRELIVAAVVLDDEYELQGADGRLVAVLLDRVHDLPVAPLYLPEPADPRLARIARALHDNPADTRGLPDLAAGIGMSPRTFSRRFHADTGTTFRDWRQQLRLLEALTRLAAGEKVNRVALELGYESTSAFVAMFRRSLGTTPGRYFNPSH